MARYYTPLGYLSYLWFSTTPGRRCEGNAAHPQRFRIGAPWDGPIHQVRPRRADMHRPTHRARAARRTVLGALDVSLAALAAPALPAAQAVVAADPQFT